jgi:hypothetical protein
MPRPLYPRGKMPRHPLDRRLGGPQSHSNKGKNKIIAIHILKLIILNRSGEVKTFWKYYFNFIITRVYISFCC